MRLTCPCGGRRVDLAHVVAHLVRAELRQLGPHPEPGRAPIPGERTRRPPRDHQVERLQQPLRHRTGALPGRGGDWLDRAHAAVAPPSRSKRGSGTAASTRSSRASAATSSARAS